MQLKEKARQLEELNRLAANSQILAPCSGSVVWVKEWSAGDTVRENKPVLCIADDSRLLLATDYISQYDIDSAVEIKAQIQEKEYDVTPIPFESGELQRLSLAGEKIRSRFAIESEDAAIKSGQFAVVTIYRSYRENVLCIPVNALYKDSGGDYVYKQEAGERVRCAVKVGQKTATKAEILEGLEEGEMVYVKE